MNWISLRRLLLTLSRILFWTHNASRWTFDCHRLRLVLNGILCSDSRLWCLVRLCFEWVDSWWLIWLDRGLFNSFKLGHCNWDFEFILFNNLGFRRTSFILKRLLEWKFIIMWLLLLDRFLSNLLFNWWIYRFGLGRLFVAFYALFAYRLLLLSFLFFLLLSRFFSL